ncbi:ImmA/IrrE family metallo-endopeptidase [Tissierella praeacuta]|uniref:ImmA/IrrE family metallo-endopeptidase n=1 Tax=Tissierella praeacuta TaxID=43131 RepID=UPI0028A87E08|nr:ImmA/IrrE family metallo-endopeptidase [Tissierella praeacuta]
MVDSYEIFNKANSIVKKSGTRDPFIIADELGIKVYFHEFQDLLGMYRIILRQRSIFINSNLDHHWRQMVLAHEIGHDIYHRHLGESGLKEFTLFKSINNTEYTANTFAAHLLLDNDLVIEYAKEGFDPSQIASILNTETNLILIKICEMNRMGYNFRIPYQPKKDFLKYIKV